ncbi:HPr kinase/phosphorylase [Novosphingobium album (ex Hu et al. 2023)]|uniref:HPr kinase/phosphatase C-terminal domain-containing protein n=1 Tax=Novosphingobium album (ex Hu et al. 2023) TaxID=2930093 RepID=A0ABT0AZ81_9SPHN|nr:HPr kinase/phosphatase C-terminal domain-containing protein [Novosphingobium album (ex Hu et al. 2023)]MCJ2177978.1 HPr kinase/phosphatase C-terminal domain-containing protein [Novosphingobium album (ex Hu et al. 2023)]
MTTAATPIVRQAGCVAIGGRGILIEGAPGTGKSSLALTLVDRGAELVSDDGVLLVAENGRVIARPHPRTRGLMEVRNLGVLTFPFRNEAPVALAIALDPEAPRYIEEPDTTEIAGLAVPLVRIWPDAHPPAIKVELALRQYGLQF